MKYRIKENEKGYYIQGKFLFFFWSNYTNWWVDEWLNEHTEIIYFNSIEKAEKEIYKDTKRNKEKTNSIIVKEIIL